MNTLRDRDLWILLQVLNEKIDSTKVVTLGYALKTVRARVVAVMTERGLVGEAHDENPDRRRHTESNQDGTPRRRIGDSGPADD